VLLHFEWFGLQFGFGRFQTTPAGIAEKPKWLIRQLLMGCSESRLTQGRVEDLLRFD
jgi:hypothetical protein